MFNKNLLIDTQTFIWFVENDPKLPVFVRNLMEDDQYNQFISIASLWEIVIKSSLDKLPLQKNIPEMIKNITKNGFFIKGVALLRFNTAPLGAVHAGSARDLFPRNSTALKDKSSIPRCLGST